MRHTMERARHDRERREVHARHAKQRVAMHKQHQSELDALAKRHENEIAAGAGIGVPPYRVPGAAVGTPAAVAGNFSPRQ